MTSILARGHGVPRRAFAPAVACAGALALVPAADANACLSTEPIRRVVQKHHADFWRCYEAGLAHDADLRGRVVVRFVIEADGRVSDARDDGSDLPSAPVVSCAAGVFRRMRFPALGAGRAIVHFPLHFQPQLQPKT